MRPNYEAVKNLLNAPSALICELIRAYPSGYDFEESFLGASPINIGGESPHGAVCLVQGRKPHRCFKEGVIGDRLVFSDRQLSGRLLVINWIAIWRFNISIIH